MSILTPRIDNIESQLPNFLINPEMRISQRGGFTTASSATHLAYYIDRWKSSVVNVTANKQHITSAQPTDITGTYSLKYIATSTAAGRLGANQLVEDYFYYLGRTLTLSAYVKSNSPNARLAIYNGTTFDVISTSHTGDGTWQRLSITGVFNAAATQLSCFVRISGIDGFNTSITSGDYIEFTGVKLELNNQVTAFVSRLIDIEYALCWRFYQICNYGCTGTAEGTTTIGVAGKFMVPMRISPSTGMARVATAAIRHVANDFNSVGTLANVTTTTLGYWLQLNGFTGLTNGLTVTDRGNSSWLAADAEL